MGRSKGGFYLAARGRHGDDEPGPLGVLAQGSRDWPAASMAPREDFIFRRAGCRAGAACHESFLIASTMNHYISY